ncbi:MAG: hypothetical protein DRO04_02465 [Candidatus Iainarchaeum archaeon]|uniref:Uncharacterized protein n=1 Tax=Candidatus Iainarchaeum sp. TaxID=3101447 RepID=A0A497JGC6_9ARCH|nr:MAG: hypothetical protein DRO04_02465 [Candidatus Diapherotrites archaeon]
MAKIRSLAEIAAKWKDVTPRRAAYYAAGIRNPKKNWEEETLKATEAWSDGVTAAKDEDRFAKGVAKAGFARWQERALKKGAEQRRWEEGVRAFASEYEKGFAPYRDVIERTELPPRYAKGDERNYDRVKVIGQALHKTRIEQYK